ncbi:unnamed protein product [Eruca vesicaria subsp. sativa]|uniref:Uncharacterized protein n=1 Tax=Eruca vesicaria subsp. sativa TaxID=29727 RepID=A0ABC8LJ62_ERUVS|nr:unnamed protein product [Eruca vesicaria subsp. sativa]
MNTNASNETIHTTTAHLSADDNSMDTGLSTDELNPTKQAVDAVEYDSKDVHIPPLHDTKSVHHQPQSPITSQNETAMNLTTISRQLPSPPPIHKTSETRTFGALYPGQWDPPSKIYDKADHPDSPEINHLLYYGLRIYEKTDVSPEPPLSTGKRAWLSPLPFTPLTSPVKSNESGLGFASHTTTPNAFKATASSNSPPAIGRPTFANENQAAEDPFVDLTTSKDPPRYVPSTLENFLAKEFFSSPLIPALDLINPLPEKEWDLFHSILKTHIDVKDLLTASQLFRVSQDLAMWSYSHPFI